MTCPRCSHENPVDAQFCGQCGAQFDVLCVACQKSNPPANRFCYRCGERLTTAAGPVLTATVGITPDDPSVVPAGDGTGRYGSTVRRRPEGDEMPDPNREPDDVGSPGSGGKPLLLCIVARDRLLTGEFLKTLQTTLDPDDELQIISDRRRTAPSVEETRRGGGPVRRSTPSTRRPSAEVRRLRYRASHPLDGAEFFWLADQVNGSRRAIGAEAVMVELAYHHPRTQQSHGDSSGGPN